MRQLDKGSSSRMLEKCLVMVFLVVVVGYHHLFMCCEAQLSYGYYRSSCPNLESILRREILRSLATDPTCAPALLRLMFHDCQVQGCDASILLGFNTYSSSRDNEMVASRNFGIRKLEVIDQIKRAVESECPGRVSCADIIALAARDAVAISGGPLITIPLGRRDSRNGGTSRLADAYIPSPSVSVDAFLRTFLSKGMTLEEAVAIIGAHTIGVGHCLNVVDRVYNPEPDDRSTNLGFQANLRLRCPSRVPRTNVTTISNDITPVIFDNQYYRDLVAGRGLLKIDSRLRRDARTAPVVSRFAADQDSFFRTFSSAFLKLSSTNVLSRSRGEVRRQCNRPN